MRHKADWLEKIIQDTTDQIDLGTHYSEDGAFNAIE